MRLIFILILIHLLAACAGTKYTVDDGRKVNEELLGHIRTYGLGEKVLRPAIVRSSALKDPECDTQWELPFSVATSYDASEDDRVAWIRGLGVDERLTIVGASPDSPFQIGGKILKIGAFDIKNSNEMLSLLEKLRDSGFPFDIQLSTNEILKVAPFKVCRGFTRFAPPSSPEIQDYHWLRIIQPLEVARANLTDDEALWMVLWGQGVSQEGGGRMKTFHYGTGIVSTLFTLTTGLKSASLASEVGTNIAKSTATSVASDLIKNQLIGQAATAVRKLSQQQVGNAMQRAAANRDSLSGIAWAASTVFEEADEWAYIRLEKLNANPMASFSLHQKLIEQGSTANSMVFDLKRLKIMYRIAKERGMSEEVVDILQGINPDEL